MTAQDKKDILQALENEWTDRIFLYYRTWIDGEANRPNSYDSEEWYKMKQELRSKATPKVKTDD